MAGVEVFCRVENGRLAPVSREDAERIAAFGRGAEVSGKISQRRSVPFHRRYWYILRRLVRDTPLGSNFPTETHLHDALKMACGYTKEVHNFTHGKILIPDSTSFSAMGQQEFREYVEKVREVILREAGIDIDDIGEAP